MVSTLRVHLSCASHSAIAISQELYSGQMELIQTGLIHHLFVENHLSAGFESYPGFRDEHDDKFIVLTNFEKENFYWVQEHVPEYVMDEFYPKAY